MKKLLASDYDGTLYFGTYKKEDIEAIRRFQEEGNLFAVNTGRALKQLEELYPQEHPFIFDAYICDSGATLAAKGKQVTERHEIPFELLRQMIEDYPDIDITFNAQGIYSTHRPSRRFDPFGKPQVFETLEELEDLPVTSLSYYFDTEKEALDHLALIQKRFPQLSAQANRTSVDCIMGGLSKKTGLETMASLLEIEPGRVYAIGDGFNDIPALLAADTGFLLESAPDLLKKQLEGKVIMVRGIAEAIERIEQDA